MEEDHDAVSLVGSLYAGQVSLPLPFTPILGPWCRGSSWVSRRFLGPDRMVNDGVAECWGSSWVSGCSLVMQASYVDPELHENGIGPLVDGKHLFPAEGRLPRL